MPLLIELLIQKTNEVTELSAGATDLDIYEGLNQSIREIHQEIKRRQQIGS